MKNFLLSVAKICVAMVCAAVCAFCLAVLTSFIIPNTVNIFLMVTVAIYLTIHFRRQMEG